MRIDELLLEQQIKNYSSIFQDIIRKAFKQAKLECDAWEHQIKTDPITPHPLEKSLGTLIPTLHK